LCTSLQRPLLASVPVNLCIPAPTSMSQSSKCCAPLTSIPLWKPDPDQYSLPSYTCYYTSVHSSSGASFLKFCHSNVSITTQTFPPSGLYLWCNGSLHTCINASTPGLCLSVIIVPQFTFYGKAEFFWIYSPQQP
jgi:hypothetical protein